MRDRLLATIREGAPLPSFFELHILRQMCREEYDYRRNYLVCVGLQCCSLRADIRCRHFFVVLTLV